MATPTDEPATTAPTVMAQSRMATRGPFEPRSPAETEADPVETDADPAESYADPAESYADPAESYVDPAGPETVLDPARPGLARRLGRQLRRHALFAVIAVVALAARAVVVAAYQPSLMYLGDSGAYLDQAWHGLWSGDWRPSGYPMFLRLVRGEEHLTRLVLVQQSMTFVVGVVTYAVAVRVTRRPWLAAVCAAPLLLSPWVLDLGQFVLAETLFSALTGLGLLLLASPGRPRLWSVAFGGLLLGASLPVRTVGYGPLAVGFVVLTGTAIARAVRAGDAGWLRAASRALPLMLAFGLAAAAPICAYSGWSASRGTGFTVSAHSGYFLYGRVAPFADCSVLPADRPELRTLCDKRPLDRRGQPDSYLWPANSPLRQGHTRIPAGREKLAGDFANAVIRAQPGMVLRTSAEYLVGYFAPTRHETPTTSRADTWELPDQLTNAAQDDDPRSADGYYITTKINHHLAGPLAAYARLAYAPMPLVGAGLVAGLVAAPIARLRRRSGPPAAFWLLGAGGLSVLALSALTAGFDYRYLASVIGILGAAAVLGAASLARALRRDVTPTTPVEAGATVPSTRTPASDTTLDQPAKTATIP